MQKLAHKRAQTFPSKCNLILHAFLKGTRCFIGSLDQSFNASL